MKLIRQTCGALLCSLLLLTAGTAGARDYLAPEAEGQGQIQTLDFANSSVLISGREYSVSASAEVEIAGSYGAFTMLEPGMLVEFIFMHYEDGYREIVELREVGEIEEI